MTVAVDEVEGSACLFVIVAEALGSACRVADIIGSTCLFVAEADTSACRGVDVIEGLGSACRGVSVAVDVDVNEG